MKNLKIAFVLTLFSALFFSCTTEDVNADKQEKAQQEKITKELKTLNDSLMSKTGEEDSQEEDDVRD